MGSIVGIDEVGRGSLAGPLLVVAAKAYGDLPDGLKDSKLLTSKQREELVSLLLKCCSFGEGWVHAAEIDTKGLARALKLGVVRAIRDLGVQADEQIVIDGTVNYIPRKFSRSSAMKGGDNLIPIISAASIYAKVTRDGYMAGLARKHPDYSFECHVGYGTKTHMLAIKSHGALKYVHRFSYHPIASLAGDEISIRHTTALKRKQPSRTI